jgi:hypothetical protein
MARTDVGAGGIGPLQARGMASGDRPIAFLTVLMLAVAVGSVAAGGGCTADVPHDPVPEEMDYDLQSLPPRAPQPTNLVIDRTTGHISFAHAGIVVAANCAASTTLSPAECEFDTYLQGLDGFPTVTPAAAPASAPLDPATLTLGRNVVVIDATTGLPAAATDVTVGFDATTNQLIVKPTRSWSLGASYWIGVRGYGNGVRAASGSEVVGSPTHALFKQPTSLTCGAATPAEVPASCPALMLLSQNVGIDAARLAVFQLEPIRQLYSSAFTLMAAAGLPKEEVAVLWGFPIHSASVPELDPTVGLVPRVTAPNEIRVAVKGTVDPATVAAVVVKQSAGTVLLMDLTAAATMDLVMGLPVVQAQYAAATGEIVITGAQPFTAGHQYGVFITNGVKNAAGLPLVPSPVSKLLTLRSPLVDGTGHSTISSVASSDAAMLEVGRAQLAPLFDMPVFAGLTGVTRENLAYCFAFAVGATP